MTTEEMLVSLVENVKNKLPKEETLYDLAELFK